MQDNTHMPMNWKVFTQKAPGLFLDVIALQEPERTLSFIPKPAQKTLSPAADFSLTQPGSYSF